MYRTGSDRIDDVLDITQMVKKMKIYDILLENSLLNEKTKYLIRHNQDNLIDLTDSEIHSNLDGMS